MKWTGGAYDESFQFGEWRFFDTWIRMFIAKQIFMRHATFGEYLCLLFATMDIKGEMCVWSTLISVSVCSHFQFITRLFQHNRK